jgi:BirA family transcriptional regulator, biotin operon repressor / biotin---[acetyl-CoA-carboxylase] ligase
MSAPALIRLDRVESTQDVLHGYASEGAAAGTAVAAVEQTGGRGRRGRAWASPPGGVWLSVLYRPLSGSAAELLSLRVGLAAAEALDAVLGERAIMLKWPNDLMLADAKIGGILCEARWQGDSPAWVVAGIGINVRNPPPVDARLPVARLADHVPGIAVDEVLGPIAAALRLVDPSGAALAPAELAAFHARDWLRNRQLSEPLPGAAAGIDASGALRVRTASGAVDRVRAGTVVVAGTVARTLHT